LRSSFGGFAYVYAVDGTVNLRLAYDTDEELATVAPDAWRLHAGHREYRVNVNITDDETHNQANDRRGSPGLRPDPT
jgi:hypothetical protein